MSAARLGFIGLGAMGGPMAANLAAKGHAPICFDAAGTAERMHHAANAAASASEVAEKAQSVFLSLPDGGVVEQVITEIAQAANRATELVVDTSTIGIDWAQRMAARCDAAGLEYLDAPVSGGAAGARAGTIALMCAGRTETIERLKPVMLDFGKHVFQVGTEPGQGQAMKLLNNFLSGTALAATSEAIAFGVGQGLDMKTMLDVINVSTGQNTATRDKFPQRVLTETYDAGFRVDQLNKDLRLYLQAATASEAGRPVSPTVVELWQQLEAVEPTIDITCIYPFVRDKRFRKG